MNGRHLLRIVSAAVSLILAGQIALAQTGSSSEATAKLIDGKPKVFVVNGYSTSFHWPKILQRKLDKYFDGKRVIQVETATKGGTPIAKWIDPETGKPKPPWERILRPALKTNDNRPRVVLAQQSLQWAFGERSVGIRGPNDKERIQKGADILQRYAEALLEDGADQVFLAMHIYKRPMEPVIGNERLALTELLKRKIPQIHAGPDVWEPTKRHYPLAFAGDGVHPNQIGAEIMAQLWVEALLKHDDLEVPDWGQDEMKKAIASPPARETRRNN